MWTPEAVEELIKDVITHTAMVVLVTTCLLVFALGMLGVFDKE